MKGINKDGLKPVLKSTLYICRQGYKWKTKFREATLLFLVKQESKYTTRVSQHIRNFSVHIWGYTFPLLWSTKIWNSGSPKAAKLKTTYCFMPEVIRCLKRREEVARQKIKQYDVPSMMLLDDSSYCKCLCTWSFSNLFCCERYEISHLVPHRHQDNVGQLFPFWESHSSADK